MRCTDETPELVANYSSSTHDPHHHCPATFPSSNNSVSDTSQTAEHSPREQTNINSALGLSRAPSVLHSSAITPSPRYHVPIETRLPVWAPGSLLVDPLAERVLPKPTLDSESVLSLHVPPKHLAVLDIGLEGTCLLRYFVEDLAKWVRVI